MKKSIWILFVVFIFWSMICIPAMAKENSLKEESMSQGQQDILQEEEIADGLVKKKGKYILYTDGIQVKEKGWHKLKKKSFYVSARGYVNGKVVPYKNTWRFYKYNYESKKWEKQKNVWKQVENKKYYFNANGNCTKFYNTVSKKYYEYKQGKRVLVKNAVRQVGNKKYYFGTNGAQVTKAGLYLTAANKVIKVLKNGRVEKTLSGKVKEYTQQDGKITGCRILDGNDMCYYNEAGELRRSIDLNEKMVALTYDDGPSIYTPVILDVLEQYNSVATFFVVGDRIPEYAQTLKRTGEIGCEIGNHTYSHATLTSISTPAVVEQIAKTNVAIQATAGVSSVVLRPPGGAYSDRVRGAVGMPIIMWSIDTLDWKFRNAASVQAAALNKVKDGDIVLMHDLYQSTAQASKVIIPELIRRGYQLVTVSELADCRGGLESGAVYYKFLK